MEDIAIQNKSSYECAGNRIRCAVTEVLNGEGVSDIPTIVIIEDEEMIRLNTQFTDHNWTTDVLAFPDEDDPGYLGDVIVNAAQAEREAEQRELPFDQELTLYIIHGTLHLCGYEDKTGDGKKTMRIKEQLYLRKAGLIE